MWQTAGLSQEPDHHLLACVIEQKSFIKLSSGESLKLAVISNIKRARKSFSGSWSKLPLPPVSELLSVVGFPSSQNPAAQEMSSPWRYLMGKVEDHMFPKESLFISTYWHIITQKFISSKYLDYLWRSQHHGNSSSEIFQAGIEGGWTRALNVKKLTWLFPCFLFWILSSSKIFSTSHIAITFL